MNNSNRDYCYEIRQEWQPLIEIIVCQGQTRHLKQMILTFTIAHGTHGIVFPFYRGENYRLDSQTAAAATVRL